MPTTIQIEFSVDNAAFGANPGSEAARILIDLAMRLDDDGLPACDGPYHLRDTNGNTVGECRAD